MTRKSTLSAESVAVINHVKAHTQCTVPQLCEAFPSVHRTQLLKRLNNLRALGWLDVASNDTGVAVWFIRAAARATKVHTTTPAEPQSAPTPPPAGQIAGPRVHNVMAGHYVPPRGPALRPGALDYRNCPSVGYRC